MSPQLEVVPEFKDRNDDNETEESPEPIQKFKYFGAKNSLQNQNLTPFENSVSNKIDPLK